MKWVNVLSHTMFFLALACFDAGAWRVNPAAGLIVLGAECAWIAILLQEEPPRRT
jgi:hypothetical protein